MKAEKMPMPMLVVRSNVKVLLTVFFNYTGVVFHEAPPGPTVNKEYYQSWILTNKEMLVHEFLAKNKTVTLPLLPYSSDLAPLTFSSSEN